MMEISTNISMNPHQAEEDNDKNGQNRDIENIAVANLIKVLDEIPNGANESTNDSLDMPITSDENCAIDSNVESSKSATNDDSFSIAKDEIIIIREECTKSAVEVTNLLHQNRKLKLRLDMIDGIEEQLLTELKCLTEEIERKNETPNEF